MHGSVQNVTFDQMKGAIGSLVWLWSGLEKELTIAIRKIHAGEVPKSAHGISRSLDVWSKYVLNGGQDRALQMELCQRITDRLMDALHIRNLVCHGLIGITAQIHHTGCEAHLTVEIGDDRRILTWSELDEMFAWMSQTKWVIRDLTDAAMDKDAAQGNASLVGWQDFPRQAAGRSPHRASRRSWRKGDNTVLRD